MLASVTTGPSIVETDEISQRPRLQEKATASATRLNFTLRTDSEGGYSVRRRLLLPVIYEFPFIKRVE